MEWQYYFISVGWRYYQQTFLALVEMAEIVVWVAVRDCECHIGGFEIGQQLNAGQSQRGDHPP